MLTSWRSRKSFRIPATTRTRLNAFAVKFWPVEVEPGDRSMAGAQASKAGDPISSGTVETSDLSTTLSTILSIGQPSIGRISVLDQVNRTYEKPISHARRNKTRRVLQLG